MDEMNNMYQRKTNIGWVHLYFDNTGQDHFHFDTLNSGSGFRPGFI